MAEEAIKQQNKINTLNCVITLNDDIKDIDTWYRQMFNCVNLNKVDDNKELFIWCNLKIQGKAATKLQNLIVSEGEDLIYPTLLEIKNALAEHYKAEDVDAEELIEELKELRISRHEDMKAFNHKYMEKYEKEEAWKGVKLLGRKMTLEAAMKTAELHEKVNQQLRKKRSAYLRRNNFSDSSYYEDSNFSNNNNNNNNNRNRNREPGHKKFECPILKSPEFLDRSKRPPSNKNAELIRNFFLDATKRKEIALEPGTEIRKNKTNSSNRNTTIKSTIDEIDNNNNSMDISADISERKIKVPSSRKILIASKEATSTHKSPAYHKLVEISGMCNNIVILIGIVLKIIKDNWEFGPE
ncbi:hypothetical protein BCR32DRAFT_287768 [Anaeromyces robustus]|uniref:Uncharacterized protein n=1 Tax=Anaeromyces robustus TaxID=1754192 RepID=A0A1Y1VQ45_9FUNG|nr:hypothetical protein BCR32DRAFT_287768 [Anaeromyces robustus]|eukprot:ORX63431.1 hypothetical protein BCR32DRAFT_287768 [Anaeromyces robustus]